LGGTTPFAILLFLLFYSIAIFPLLPYTFRTRTLHAFTPGFAHAFAWFTFVAPLPTVVLPRYVCGTLPPIRFDALVPCGGLTPQFILPRRTTYLGSAGPHCRATRAFTHTPALIRVHCWVYVPFRCSVAHRFAVCVARIYGSLGCYAFHFVTPFRPALHCSVPTYLIDSIPVFFFFYCVAVWLPFARFTVLRAPTAVRVWHFPPPGSAGCRLPRAFPRRILNTIAARLLLVPVFCCLYATGEHARLVCAVHHCCSRSRYRLHSHDSTLWDAVGRPRSVVAAVSRFQFAACVPTGRTVTASRFSAFSAVYRTLTFSPPHYLHTPYRTVCARVLPRVIRCGTRLHFLWVLLDAFARFAVGARFAPVATHV